MTEPVAGEPHASSYSALAFEYYDSARHPTCAAFRAASAKLVTALVPAVSPAESVEVGAGDSLLARELDSRGQALDGLLVTDDSPEMLEHSRWAASRGAKLVVAPAHELPLAPGAASLVVASLADPYDDSRLWSEIARVLSPSGVAVVTTPSWEWASSFRRSAGDDPHSAMFELADGSLISVPSVVRTRLDETALAEAAGLRVTACHAVSRRELRAQSAPKLDVLGEDDPVVMGYVATAAGS